MLSEENEKSLKLRELAHSHLSNERPIYQVDKDFYADARTAVPRMAGELEHKQRELNVIAIELRESRQEAADLGEAADALADQLRVARGALETIEAEGCSCRDLHDEGDAMCSSNRARTTLNRLGAKEPRP